MAWGHNHPPPLPQLSFKYKVYSFVCFIFLLQLHFVHWNSTCPSFKDAVGSGGPNGLCVLGFFLKVLFFQCSLFGMVFWLHQKIYLKLVLPFVGWSRKCSPETNHRLTSSSERSCKYSDLLKLSVLNLWLLRVTSM